MPHRELPDDFEKRYKSIWVTPPFHELADAKRVGQYYNLGARVELIDKSGHLPTAEHPARVAKLVEAFLST